MGIFDLLEDVVTIAIAPVKIAANVAQVITRPVAEIVEEIVDASKELTE